MDVLCVGGATVDLFLVIDPQNPHFKFNQTTNEMSVHLGDKVSFNNADFKIGGNACNVAVGLKRLGVESSLMAEIGDDEFSQKILKSLELEGVDTGFLKKGQGESSFSVILNYQGDRVIFSEKKEKEHDFNFDDVSSSWVYLTSLGQKWDDAYKKTFDFIKRTGAKLVFNPGAVQLDKGIESFSYLLPQTEVLIVNKEEAIRITNYELGIGNEDTKEVLLRLKALGAKIAVITDGEKGSDAISQSGEVFHQDIFGSESISKTGAGDAYSSGFLGALFYGKTIQEAMLWGSKNAASVISKVGAQTGLLTKEQLTIDI